jgi:hypothetical protein
MMKNKERQRSLFFSRQVGEQGGGRARHSAQLCAVAQVEQSYEIRTDFVFRSLWLFFL